VTLFALAVNIESYASFLQVIGSMFVPLLGVGVGDAVARRGYADQDHSVTAPSRPLMLVAWLVGLVVYQLVNPGGLTGWSDLWTGLQGVLGFSPPSWLSASLVSFLCAAVFAAALSRLSGNTPAHSRHPDH
jgi:purine-cytosine permease-like protein